MEDDYDRPRKTYPLSPAKMSKTPSWVMLGFVLGAVTVFSLPPLKKEKVAGPVMTAPKVEPPKPTGPRERPQLTKIEAVFEEWARYAVWEYDTTEVALWNTEANDFSEFYEVRRYANRYYFRTIPSLTRRIINRGRPMPECPLKFTETEEQYQEWRDHGRSERVIGDYRPVSAFPPVTPSVPPGASSAPAENPLPQFQPIVPFEPPPLTTPGAKK